MKKIIISLVIFIITIFGINSVFATFELKHYSFIEEYGNNDYNNYISQGDSDSNDFKSNGNYYDFENELFLYGLNISNCKYISNYYKSFNGLNVYFACSYKESNKNYNNWNIFVNGEKLTLVDIEGRISNNGPAVTSIRVNNNIIKIEKVVSYFVGAKEKYEFIYKRNSSIYLNKYLSIFYNKLTKYEKKQVDKLNILLKKVKYSKIILLNKKLEKLNILKFNKYKNILGYLKLKVRKELFNRKKNISIDYLLKKYENGKKVSELIDYDKIKEIFGIDNEEVPLDNYLKKLDSYLIFEKCSDAYGECTKYFYNIKTKKMFYMEDILNFSSDETDLEIGKINGITKNKTEIKYIGGTKRNGEFNFNLKKDLKINKNIVKYFK